MLFAKHHNVSRHGTANDFARPAFPAKTVNGFDEFAERQSFRPEFPFHTDTIRRKGGKLYGVFACWTTGVALAATDQEIRLKLGETAAVGNASLQILFTAVTHDSRCPAVAQCIWEGEAEVIVQLEKKSEKPVAAKMGIRPGRQSEPIAFGGYWIRLTALHPDPTLGSETNSAVNTVTIVVSEQMELTPPAVSETGRFTAPAPPPVPARPN